MDITMEFSIHYTLSAPELNAEEWNTLLGVSITDVPFLRWEYLTTWWETRGGGEWPESSELAVITARKEERLVGIAPFFLVNKQEGEEGLLLLGSVEISDYLDIIVRPMDLQPFISGLLDFLIASTISWKVLEFDNLLETSPSIPVLRTEAELRGLEIKIEQTYHAPSIPLTGDFETYLAGIDKKQRHEIRRKMRRAEEVGTIDWYIVEDEASLDAEMEAFLALMAVDPEKAVFLTEAMREQMHRSARAAFKAGWLQLAFLTVNGEKICGYFNLDYQNRILVYNSGTERRFLELSPGWVLLGHMLKWANDNQRIEFDFMRGTEDYKYRFGGVDKRLAKVIIRH
jgi:CelD/BcsL family acetyltransferase involved in cellulose biosynthesis